MFCAALHFTLNQGTDVLAGYLFCCTPIRYIRREVAPASRRVPRTQVGARAAEVIIYGWKLQTLNYCRAMLDPFFWPIIWWVKDDEQVFVINTTEAAEKSCTCKGSRRM